MVKKAYHRRSGSTIAIKSYDKTKLDSKMKKKSVDREINILRKLDH